MLPMTKYLKPSFNPANSIHNYPCTMISLNSLANNMTTHSMPSMILLIWPLSKANVLPPNKSLFMELYLQDHSNNINNKIKPINNKTLVYSYSLLMKNKKQLNSWNNNKNYNLCIIMIMKMKKW